MFEYLASEEEEHIKTLEKQYEAFKKDKRWLVDEDLKPLENVCPLVSPEKSDFWEIDDIMPKDSEVSRDETNLEALKLGIEVKKRAIKFYCTAAEKMGDSYWKRMFSHLVDIESRHLRELEVQFAWLEQAGFWYDHHMMTD